MTIMFPTTPTNGQEWPGPDGYTYVYLTGLGWRMKVGSGLAPGSIGTAELTDGGVQTVDVGDGSITVQKLAADVTALIAQKLGLAGGTMTGPIDMSNQSINNVPTPSVSNAAANKAYVDLLAGMAETAAKNASLPRAGGAMTGAIDMGAQKITNLAAPTVASDAATKAYIDAVESAMLRLAGGAMTGDIAMGGHRISGLPTPTAADEPVRKDYADALLALKLSLSGGTLTGPLTLSGDGTTNLHAVTKQQMDAAVSGAIAGVNDASEIAVVPTGNLAATTVQAALNELQGDIDGLGVGNHTHANKALLDTYTQAEADLADAVAKKHAHANGAYLDTLTNDAAIKAAALSAGVASTDLSDAASLLRATSVVNDVTTGGTTVPLSAQQGVALKALIDALTTSNAGKLDASGYTAADVIAKLLTVDGAGTGLDADTLDGLQASALVQVSQIVNDLTTGGTTVPLSAEQGKVLNTLVLTGVGTTTTYATIAARDADTNVNDGDIAYVTNYDGSGHWALYVRTSGSWALLLDQVSLGAAVTGSLQKDGSVAATGNLPMGNHKITGLAAATANGDAVRYEEFVAATQKDFVAAEIDTGQKWLGASIYAQVASFTGQAAGASFTLATIAGMTGLLSVEGYATNGAARRPIGASGAAWGTGDLIEQSGTTVSMTIGSAGYTAGAALIRYLK